jgi:hypothetical protein
MSTTLPSSTRVFFWLKTLRRAMRSRRRSEPVATIQRLEEMIAAVDQRDVDERDLSLSGTKPAKPPPTMITFHVS